MYIIIHGTKGGYKVLYPIDGFSPIGDVRSNTNDERSVGEEAYSISFTRTECVFSKYKIIRDESRSLSLGNIAFSIIIPYSQKLSGVEVKSLLDKLSDHYCRVYAHNNNLNNTSEDWTFVENIVNAFIVVNIPSDDSENIQQGPADAAFVYYLSDEELQKYFNLPYQEEYSPFKQVFFVQSDMKNNLKNPLNALKHDPMSDLTGKVDLDNYYYRLKEYHGQGKNGVSIEIRANGRLRYNKDKIFKKDDISIKYSKNKYFEEINVDGKLTDLKIAQYLIIDGIFKKIEVIKNVDLPQKLKTINFELKDREGKPVDNAEIQIGTQPWQKIIGYQYEYIFKGEELKYKWTVTGKKGNDFIAQPVTFTPEDCVTSILLTLYAYKKVRFHVKDAEGLVFDYSIQIKDKQGKVFGNGKEFEFIGEDVFKTYNITIISNHYETQTFTFCPANDESLNIIELTKKHFGSGSHQGIKTTEKRYYLKINEKYGKRSYHKCQILNWVDEFPQFGSDPRFGYRFTKWEPHEDQPYGDYDGYYEAIFTELWYYKIPKWGWLVFCIVVALIVAFLLLLGPFKSGNHNTPQVYSNQIISYIEGDTLLLNKLIIYKENWEEQKPETSNEGRGVFDFFGKRKQTNNIEYKEWNDILQRLDKAITKRKLIDARDIKELKLLTYSRKHILIDSINYEDIKNKLGDCSALTLTEIVNSIETIITAKKPIEERKEEQGNELETSKSKGNPQSTTLHKEKQTTQLDQKPVTTDKISESKIIQYLKGNELNIEKLQAYKDQVVNRNLKASVELCLKFWTLNGRKNNSYSSLKSQIERRKDDQYSCLIDSELKRFLDIMSLQDTPQYFIDLPQSDKNRIKTLSQLKIKIQ